MSLVRGDKRNARSKKPGISQLIHDQLKVALSVAEHCNHIYHVIYQRAHTENRLLLINFLYEWKRSKICLTKEK